MEPSLAQEREISPGKGVPETSRARGRETSLAEATEKKMGERSLYLAGRRERSPAGGRVGDTL